MNTNLWQYNIQAPILPIPILHRESLIHLLAEHIKGPDTKKATSTKFILLCAPAGYGKTTLLVDTLLQHQIICSWFFFEETDTPAIFLKGVLSSVQKNFPQLVPSFAAVLALEDVEINEHPDGELYWKSILDLMVTKLNGEISQHFVLAFCNYHKLQPHEALHRLLNHLLEHPFQRGVLVLESRSMPDLKLAPLIAQRQMFGLGSSRLSFTAQELLDLAHLQGFTNFSLPDAEHLITAFDGWISGILLGSSLGYTQMHPLVPSHKGNWGTSAQIADHQQLFSYISEIFRQEMETFTFLEAVSIFEQLTAPLCDRLLETTNSAERLIYAEQQGLFVMRDEKSIDEGKVGVYICHPILRALLQERLRNQSATRYQELQRKTIHLLQQDHAYAQAIRHALEAHEYRLAISIIVQVAPELINQGQSETVDLWLKGLPEHIFKKEPWLLMTQINIYLAQNEYTEVSTLLDKAEALLIPDTNKKDLPPTLRLQAELRLARSKLLFYQGNFQRARELCLENLDFLPDDEIPLKIKTYHRLGACLIVGMGLIHEGIIQFQKALQLNTSQNNDPQAATLHRLLASAYSWTGNYQLADYHQVRALRIWEKLQQPRGLINNLTGIGLLQLRQGLMEQAEGTLVRALQMAKVNLFKSGEAYALIALGELYSALTQYVRALDYLEDGLRLAQQCQDLYLINCGLCSIATAYLSIGEIQTSHFFLQQVYIPPQKENTYEDLLHSLTQGRLALAQEDYTQAQQELEHAVALGKFTTIQFLSIRALLLLAVCYTRQQQPELALQTIQQTITLNANSDLTTILKLEASHYPELLPLFAQSTAHEQQQMPAIAQHSSSTQTPIPPPERIHTLRIMALGEPQLLIDDVPVTRWHMQRALELFYLLLEHNHPLSKEKMIDALWPHATQKQIDTTMRTTIYYLRQAIGKACILYERGLYSLNLAALNIQEIWYDVAVFDKLYATAMQALEMQDDATASATLHQAVSLYKGNYLQPFYNDWCAFRRNQLRQAYMDAHEQLALLAWRQEYWDECIEHWQVLLSHDPCFEKAHHGIMLCYLRQGKRELALRQYQLCVQHLHEELHIKPGQSIEKLYKRINTPSRSNEKP
ncbi:hypothetical protein KDA_47790 [Dictyobacter alpinus]|uniref:Bacterial transcriptional activator domain-containing protein n=1 Tax=Dictyobacter alpinus TaxID=2014873 RepID=A0A402BD60_9CHLR|nr:BTAD domain-containing putative transcriptional regulator [Dictyobacter alpinus]GCE29295.1 hypothetical protein KDA_47790 [Dictyobacter alpinus]